MELQCPTDHKSVNEYQVRLTALGVWALLLAYLLFASPWILVVLVLDFGLRVFKLARYSPLFRLGGGLVQALSLGHKPVDQAPKRFAAGVGLALSLVAGVSHLTGNGALAWWVSLLIAGFATLEWVVGFCAGCYVYSFLLKLRPVKLR